jgi:hypothetical protein
MRDGATQAMRVHCRGAPTKQMLTRRRNPLGAWGLRADLFVARRQRGTRIASSSRLDLDPQAPCARHILILGQAPSDWVHALLMIDLLRFAYAIQPFLYFVLWSMP